MEVNLISKKRNHKQNFMKSGDSNRNKVVFAILTEVVTFYIGPCLIDVR